MRLSKNEIENLIKERCMFNQDTGIDNFPGELLILDRDEILYEPDWKCTIKLYAWYDKDCDKNKSFIISYAHNYIILNWWFEASPVYEFLLNKYIIN